MKLSVIFIVTGTSGVRKILGKLVEIMWVGLDWTRLVPVMQYCINGRRLHKEELHNMYASPNIIKVINSRRMRWMGRIACMGEMINAYKILVRISEGKRQHGSLRCRWEDIVRLDLWETVGMCGQDSSGSG
jgi:hypothetical protein